MGTILRMGGGERCGRGGVVCGWGRGGDGTKITPE